MVKKTTLLGQKSIEMERLGMTGKRTEDCLKKRENENSYREKTQKRNKNSAKGTVPNYSDC